MNLTYFFAPEIIKEIDIPERGILSRTLYDDNDVKVVLFGFSAGHELSAHTAPMTATLYFLQGEAELTLEADSRAVKQGAFAESERLGLFSQSPFRTLRSEIQPGYARFPSSGRFNRVEECGV